MHARRVGSESCGCLQRDFGEMKVQFGVEQYLLLKWLSFRYHSGIHCYRRPPHKL